MTPLPAIAEAHLALVRTIAERRPLPRVRQLWLPEVQTLPERSAEFGALVLEDGSVGLIFVLLKDTLAEIGRRFLPAAIVGERPEALAEGFADPDPACKALGLAAVNAIAQHLFRTSGYSPPACADSFGGLAPRPGDHIGLVGYFPPLVERLAAQGIRTTVIELKRELLGRAGIVEVTDNPARLGACDKILCTSTTLLNDTLDEILGHCPAGAAVAVIGPSAGFLPDPLFDRGVDIVGGNRIVDTRGFLGRCAAGEPWGGTSRKYCLDRPGYPGYRALLAS